MPQYMYRNSLYGALYRNSLYGALSIMWYNFSKVCAEVILLQKSTACRASEIFICYLFLLQKSTAWSASENLCRRKNCRKSPNPNPQPWCTHTHMLSLRACVCLCASICLYDLIHLGAITALQTELRRRALEVLEWLVVRVCVCVCECLSLSVYNTVTHGDLLVENKASRHSYLYLYVCQLKITYTQMSYLNPKP